MSGRVSFDGRVETPPHVVRRRLDGELVLLNLENECYYGLDAIGTRMLELLESSASIEVAYELLLAEYDVDSRRLREDLEALLVQLRENGLIELLPS